MRLVEVLVEWSCEECESGVTRNLPLLGTVPALEEGNRDEDDDSLLAVAGLDLENPGVSVKPPSAHRLSQIEMYYSMYPASPMCAASDEPLGVFVPGNPSLVCGCVFCFLDNATIALPGCGSHLTSRAETNWRGLRAAFMSGMLVSSS